MTDIEPNIIAAITLKYVNNIIKVMVFGRNRKRMRYPNNKSPHAGIKDFEIINIKNGFFG